MMNVPPRVSRQTWRFSKDIRIMGSGVATGPLEGQGPLGEEFDIVHEDNYANEDSWEKAERKMMAQATEVAIKKSNITGQEIDVMLAGDLLNQIITSNYTARGLELPLLGLFGACSTSMEGLALAAALVDGGFVRYALTGCSSHNSTAERQFRYPTEYGGQKPPHAQFTVTGAGASVVGLGASGPRITHATVGKVTDLGIKDPFDMGSAMAPAAADTISTHFKDLDRTPQDYDLIVTGDLGKVGYAILKDMMMDLGYDMTPHYSDCGLMIYSPSQDVFSGGSGCASSAVVTYSHIVNGLQNGRFGRVLVVATGALFSPISFQQGESIPCIAHGVVMEGVQEG
ncbi:stage V sporulation protein AD [Ammoniphilus sp. CFH 90114]|uniref:stage V sporulation protein AD n=1 Tax=Ammoniphilus sp. CFH 90114 TaxID=2493665 RepID=UPI00100FF03D|nr:stage V sporulation protein AD [Ammoniphilus sp. CFH 90114]RXT13841.1 stage V sporulation protein AD [Ammoniphilus sp. CFH 90114]